MDIPYSSMGTIEDYEATWKPKRIQFRDHVRCVASLFKRYFEKFKTSDSWKVLIECVDEITEPGVRVYSGVCTVQVQFHVDTFFSMNDLEKKETTLDLMRKGIYTIISEEGWNEAPFEKAFEQVMAVKLVNEWFWKKPLLSSDRKYKASLYIVHEVTVVKAYLIILNKNNREVLRLEAFKERPNEWNYARYLGKLVWLSQNEVVLFNKNNETVRKATVSYEE
ncbi:hypothetical protein NST84_11805 [Paenibacillus sp. FSL R7-0345]|uniref:hypothetical protein n=1 Tax=Paenibacillus sp. FSL R7-0345 TaxID=2954535 RepID=UPI00315A86E0